MIEEDARGDFLIGLREASARPRRSLWRRLARRPPGFANAGPPSWLHGGVTLALGIGANTAIFSVVNAVLLRPLPSAIRRRAGSAGIAYNVSQRHREIGVRMALGAAGRHILGLVLRQGLMLTLVGTVLGLAGAFATTRFLRTLLFGITPTDPIAYVAISVLLTAVALLACWIPARRAIRVDPMKALRYE